MDCAFADGSAYGWIFPLICLAMMVVCILFATRCAGGCNPPSGRRKKAPHHPQDRGIDSGG